MTVSVPRKRRGYDRKAIIIRDNCCCRRCGVGVEVTPLEIHHIVALVFGGTNDHSNLAALCRQCHKRAPDLAPGEEAEFAAWCETPAEHLLLAAAELNLPSPRDVVLGYSRLSKALKKGLAEDEGDLAVFLPYLGPNADALRAQYRESGELDEI